MKQDVTRRQALKTLLIAAASGTLWNAREILAKSPRANVIVVGAGIAGLTAARELKAQGFGVTVIEARDRLGGRIWTDRSLGTPLDFGASWIHETDGNPIARLARDFGVKTIETDYESIYVYDHTGEKMSDDYVEEIVDGTEEILEEAFALSRKFDRDVSMAYALDHAMKGVTLTQEETYALNWRVTALEVEAAADFKELSLSGDNIGDKGFDGGDELFPDGYDQIVRRVARGLDFRLGHKVQRIIYNKQGVKIVTDRGAFVGDGAVITLPLGVLKSGSVKFSPPLPDYKQKAIAMLQMGVLNKVALRFSTPFWATDRDFIGYISEKKGHFPVFLNWHKYTKQPVLIGFTGGSFARSIEKLSDREIAEQTVGVLRKMFGRRASDPTGVKVARWSSDPFAHGSYSIFPPGAQGEAYDALAEPVGRLFFAGEATIRDHPATVHGAFLSGIREGRRISKL